MNNAPIHHIGIRAFSALISLIVILVSFPHAQAHSGHAVSEAPLSHLIGSGYHSGVFLLLALATFLAARLAIQPKLKFACRSSSAVLMIAGVICLL